MIDIFAVKLTQQIEESDFKKILLLLSEEKRNRILNYRNFMDAQRGLVGAILVRKIICNRTGWKNEVLKFEINRFGKPFLKNTEEIKFNISHSGEWVVCAVSEQEIGIDIELIKSVDIHFAKRIFTDEEYSRIIEADNEQQLEYFYKLWTCKESYIKAVGKGLFMALNSFSIDEKDNPIKIRVAGGSGSFNIRMYDIDKSYKMAVCSNSGFFPDEINVFNIETLIEKICRETL